MNKSEIACMIKNMKSIRSKNLSSKMGEECCCPSCGSKFIKTTYNQVFCKVKGGTICKDGYWNFVIGSKRNNTTRISPANSAYYEKYITPRIIEDDGLDYLLERG